MNQDIFLDKKVIEKLGILKFKSRKIISEISKNQVNNENIAKLAILSAYMNKPFYIYSGSKELDKYIFICINNIFSDAKPFQIKIDKDTTIDDVLGPVDEKSIAEGKYLRKIIGFLTASDVCLLSNALDANKYLKNVILDFMLQSTYMNNGSLVHLDVPLKIMTGKFNRPTDEASKYIWDAVFLKYYINTASNAIDIQRGSYDDVLNYETNLKDEEKFKLEDIEFVRQLAKHVQLDEVSKEFLSLLKAKIETFNNARNLSKQGGIDKILNNKQTWNDVDLALKISALLNGRTEVDITDCFVIEHILWNQPIHANVISKFINEVASNFEYGFYSQYKLTKEKYLAMTKYIKENVLTNLDYEKVVEKKIFINNLGKYYFFSSEDYSHNIFINISDINMLDGSVELLKTLNLSIKTYSKSDFVNNTYSNQRLFLNFDGSNYYIFEKNDVNGKRIKILPDLIEIDSNHVRTLHINDELLNDINNWMKAIFLDLHHDIKELAELLQKDFSKLTKVNIFICDRNMDFYKKTIRDTLNKLNRIRESIQLTSTNIKLISKGMYNGDVEKITPELGF
ncbi:MAG: hypothetical protein ACRCVI_02890 [Mycoplasmoidaceae bacterium]